jgi:threonine synthase
MTPREPEDVAARRGRAAWQVPTPARGPKAVAGTDEGERPRPVNVTTTKNPSRFGFASHLACRECGATAELGGTHVCAQCFGPLEVSYDLPALTRSAIESGPQNIWRYASLLPVPADVAASPSTEPGCTRLVRAHQLARELGMSTLWVKDERGNPTHSFKDRVVAVALAAAVELGYKVLACPSTGNLANAVAAAAARAGIRSVVLIPADLEQQKISATAVYGGTMVPVDGTYDDVNRLASELADEREDWAFVNVNVRPYYAEGSKTIGYEIAEQLGWRLPAQIVVPVASGAQLVKIDKAFRELISLGLVEDTSYRVFGAQASGCAPVAAAFRAGHDVVQPVRPSTVAKSLAIGNPADGPYVLDVVRRTGGCVADVSDPEVVSAMRLLAGTEGIFGETAAGVTLGVLRRLLAERLLDPAAETVIINSGDGLKTLDAVTDRASTPAPIRPTLAAFRSFEGSPALPGSP